MTAVTESRSGDDGFTLIETLVTLAVLAFVSTLLLSAIVAVRQTARHMLSSDSDNVSVATAQSILRSRIEHLRAVPRSGGVSPVIDFEGNGEQLSFFAPPIERNAPGGLQAFRFLRTATGDVVLFSSPYLSENIDLRANGIAGWTPTKLLSGVDRLSIAYFGHQADGKGGTWQRFWSNRAQPPSLIRIGIQFAPGDRRSWPDLVVRPIATVNLACRLDPTTARCGDDLIR